MAILAYLGWSSYPVAFLGADQPSKLVLEDLKRWSVKTDFIYREKKNSTPIVLERLSNHGSVSDHSFEFKCPYCGSRFPRTKELPTPLALRATQMMPRANVFYFDRATRTGVELASIHRSQGALVVFEPYRIGREKLFTQCLKVAHIVKYSHEQVEARLSLKGALLEIQTLGAEGLRYKFRKSQRSGGDWTKMSAYNVPKIVDSAGAGDWCTAGVIQMLGQEGYPGLLKSSVEDVQDALRFGQSLAALCCGYEGPRGLMYFLKKMDLELSVRQLVDGSNHEQETRTMPRYKHQTIFKYICSICQGRPGKKVSNSAMIQRRQTRIV